MLALNPDTSLEPDFLERLLPAFDDPRVGMAAGKLLRFDRSTLDSAGQRLDMIGQLKEIVSEMKKQNKLLLEQNKLLKSGKLQVVVAIDRNPGR